MPYKSKYGAYQGNFSPIESFEKILIRSKDALRNSGDPKILKNKLAQIKSYIQTCKESFPPTILILLVTAKEISEKIKQLTGEDFNPSFD